MYSTDPPGGAQQVFRLRDYQQDLLNRARQALKTHQRVIVQAPTGSGKTALIVTMMARAAERGIPSVFVVHRHELLEQTGRALDQQGVTHGIIASGHRRTSALVQVASIQTLVRREVAEPGLLVIDEAHRSASQSYRDLIAAWPNAYVVGLTATPARTDGQGLSDLYSGLVCGPSVRELIDAGWLADYTLYAPPSDVQTQGLHKRQGDYVRSEVEQAVDQAKVTGDAVEHYKKLGGNPRTIVFCVTRSHAYHVAQQYRIAGIDARAVTGETPAPERRKIVGEFKNGFSPDVLVGVDLFIEGYDCGSIQVAQILRPTASLIVWMQAVGRALRPKPDGSKAVILDHVGNAERHGLPDDEREWTLEDVKRKGGGEASEEASQGGGGREEPYQADGELVEVDRKRQRRRMRREEGMAETLEDLVELAVKRGYKPAWAGMRYHGRHGGDKRELIKQSMKLYKEIAMEGRIHER